MTQLSVIRSFTMADGHKIVSIRPDAMRTAIKAAAAVTRDTPKTGSQTIASKASDPARDRKP